MLTPQIRTLLADPPLGADVEACGWVKTRRDSGAISFVELNDGSCLASLQVVVEEGDKIPAGQMKKVTTGSCLRVRGRLVESPAKGQAVELRADTIDVLGTADPATYPLQKKRHSFEFLRTIAHLRPRTNALSAVARVRSALGFAVHDFFRERGFVHIHTPIITTSDCEGAGEMFLVTALEPGRLSSEEDFAGDFFGRRAGLTVSGQLQAEIYAMALGRVYTFGPTFRAEHSNTSRHLAEFWMVEPEMAFCDLFQDMELAEELIVSLVRTVLEECAPELELFNRFVEKGLMQRLESILKGPFTRISYTDAVKLLAVSGRDFEFPVEWGVDLQSEHERFLCEEAGGPVIVHDYPAAIKPFYMRRNDDGKTVAAMDILVPSIGELVGGSQREERSGVLEEVMREAGLDMEEYGWYLDLRRYGTAPHAGFGLGFERMVQLVTGMPNIREVIPFPRTPGSAAC
ncbi:MAG: asparagine--tRNA ligase [Desulfobulbaceae bacterium]